MDSLRIGPRKTVPAELLSFEATLASGPGGQKVNKTASVVLLKLEAASWSGLSLAAFTRLRAMAGRRMNAKGVVLIRAGRHRSQSRNLEDARERLRELLLAALAPPPPKRRATKPSRSAKRRRLADKRQAGEKKRLRKAPGSDN